MAPGESLTVQRLEGSFDVLSPRNVSVASRVIFTTYLSHPIYKVIIASKQDTEEFHKFLHEKRWLIDFLHARAVRVCRGPGASRAQVPAKNKLLWRCDPRSEALNPQTLSRVSPRNEDLDPRP